MGEVAKHYKKGDLWVVLSNIGTQVGWSLDVDLGSEVVFWYVPHVHDHSPLPIPLRRY